MTALLPLPIAPADALAQIIRPALALLPARMRSERAEVMLLATAGQESGLAARWQAVRGRPAAKGPARGLWQFERGAARAGGGGVWGVFLHDATHELLRALARARGVRGEAPAIWRALEADDILAAGLARLLLWTDPAPLPELGDPAGAWAVYRRVWHPGKPHPDRWPRNYDRAIAAVRAGDVNG